LCSAEAYRRCDGSGRRSCADGLGDKWQQGPDASREPEAQEITSLTPVPGQGSNTPYPTFLTKENQIGPEYAPRLEIEYTIVPIPEPNTATSILLGVSVLAGCRAWRRRFRFS